MIFVYIDSERLIDWVEGLGESYHDAGPWVFVTDGWAIRDFTDSEVYGEMVWEAEWFFFVDQEQWPWQSALEAAFTQDEAQAVPA